MGGQVGLSGLFYSMNAGFLCACVFLCAALLHYYGSSNARDVIARQCRVASSSCLVLAGRALALMASRVQCVRCLLCFVGARCFLLLRVPFVSFGQLFFVVARVWFRVPPGALVPVPGANLQRR